MKRAAGGEGQVSGYVARARAEYQEREGLGEVLAAWQIETPVPVEVNRQVEAELDDELGIKPGRGTRLVG